MDQNTIHALTGVLAVLLGGLIVIIPVAGLTLRLALRPVLQSWLELKERQLASSGSEALARRIGILEAELQQVQSSLHALSEADDFRRRLEEGSARPEAVRR